MSLVILIGVEGIGFWVLCTVSVLFAGIYVWAIPSLIIWDYFPDILPDIYDFEMFAGVILFGSLAAYLFIKLRTPSNQINQGQG